MQHRTGQLSRADLLKVLVEEDQVSVELIAEQLELEKNLCCDSPGGESPQGSGAQAGGVVSVGSVQGADATDPSLSTVIPRESFWMCTAREQLDSGEIPVPDDIATTETVNWPDRPEKPPTWYPLAKLRDVLPRLLRSLGMQSSSRQPDTARIVRAVSRGEFMRRIPRKARHSVVQTVHVIDDRHIHLTPFWQDHSWLKAGLQSVLPDYAYSGFVLPDGREQPCSLVNGRLQEWRLPDASETVLILSDLGALDQGGGRSTVIWLELVRQLVQKRCAVMVLLPLHPADCDERFNGLLEKLSWLPEKQPVKNQQVQWREQTEQLLSFLAPAVRLEPGLIRQMRLAYNGFDPDGAMPPALESMVWQHAAIAERHSTAASWRVEPRLAYLDKFSGSLNPKEKQLALDVIRSWRGHLSEQVWFEEIIELDTESQKLMEADLQVAIAYFQRIDGQYRHDPLLLCEEDRSWLRRVLQRLPDYVLEHQQVGGCFQRLKYALGDGSDKVDPRHLAPTQLSVRQVELGQMGQQLCLSVFQPQEERPLGFSPLALFTLRHPFVQLRQQGHRIAEISLEQRQSVVLPVGDSFELVSDCERLEFESWFRPDYCEQVGQDQFGLYLDLLLPMEQEVEFLKKKLLKQRFRYIPPQIFVMGLQDRESYYNSFAQHKVTLTKGYWLADTATTQAFWQAIMVRNPSLFKAKKKPVETISWKDVQSFIEKLNSYFPMLEVALPTEAEWECACRAGTDTPFSFGNHITLKQVNFVDRYPRQHTVEVKSLPANKWGLYEMHGNVFEWCQDGWLNTSSSTPVTDPLNEASSMSKVIRGGSWHVSNLGCRSDSRDWHSFSYSGTDVGFRLVLRSVVKSHESLGNGLVSEQALLGEVPRRNDRQAEEVENPHKLNSEQSSGGIWDKAWHRLRGKQ